MANEKDEPKKPGGASAASPKRPTTIDLKATDVTPEPAGATDKAEAASRNTGDNAETAPQRESARDGSAASPKDWPWPAIGIAAAAAIIFFIVGLGAGQWLFDRAIPQAALTSASGVATPSPELLARLDKVEAQMAVAPKDDPQLQARLAKLEAQLGAPRPDDPQLQGRLAKLEAQLNVPRATDPQLIARIAAAEATVKTLADLAASREKRNDDIAEIARDARDRASNAASAVEAAQKAQSASPQARADLDAMSTRIAALEQSARNSQAELARRQSTDDAKGRFAIAAIALRDAVDSGMPFSGELAAAKSLSADPAAFAALEPFAASGIPSAAALGRELASLMPAIWKVGRKEEPQSGTFLERLQANAEKIVRIRPAGEVAGDDPASIRARIETRAGNADIRGALAELSKLPPEARAPADAWIRKAQARNDALAAARNVSQTALGALVKPAS